MNRKEHPHAEALRALADGFELQWQFTACPSSDWSLPGVNEWFALAAGTQGFSFRKKPDAIRFRVGVIETDHEGDRVTLVLSQVDATLLEGKSYFRGWATDWIETSA